MRFGLRSSFVLSVLAGLAGCPSDEVTQGRDTDETTSTTSSGSGPTSSDVTTGPSTNTASQSTTDPTDSTTDSSASTSSDGTTSTDSTGTATDGSTGSTGGGGNFACADATLSGAFPLEDTGTLAMGDGDDFEAGEPCSGGSGGYDLAFSFTAPDAGTYVISTLGTSFDTILMAYDDCDAAALLECNDDIDFDNDIVTSAFPIDLQAGQTILIVLDGWDETQTGAYTLTIEPQA